MVQVKVPLVAQWNSKCCCCVTTPDGGFLYIGYRSINFIGNINASDEVPLIKTFHTRQPVLNVDVDPHWNTNNPKQNDSDVENNTNYFAILSQDNSVQIWDFNKGCAVSGHKVHSSLYSMEGNGPAIQYTGNVMISYMRNRNVLSVDNRYIVIYCVASNSYYRHSMFVTQRSHQITALKCCPYSENYFALGTSRGLVLLCDLQQMCIVYTLSGHNTSVTSLAWIKIDLEANINDSSVSKTPDWNVTPLKKQRKPTDLNASDDGNAFNIYEYNYLENEFGVPSHCEKDSSNTRDGCTGLDNIKSSTSNTEFNFAEACQNLKYDIISMGKMEQTSISSQHIVTLDDCKNSKTYHNDSYSNCDSQSLNGNLDTTHDKDNLLESNFELINHSYSDESMHVDGIDKFPSSTLLHQADIHDIQLSDNNMKTETIKIKSNIVFDTENQENQENQENRENRENDLAVARTELIENHKCTLWKGLKDENLNSDILLASASIDGSIWIFNALSGSCCDNHRVRDSKGKSTITVHNIHIHWLNSTTLMVNSKSGDLHFWTMHSNCLEPSGRVYKFKDEKRKSLHRGVIAFSVSQTKQLVWCISSYRQITLEDVATHELKINLACVSSNISALAECPDDMNKVAIGFCDRRVGIIDISSITPVFIHIDNYVQHVEAFVLSMAWNPDNTRIAYGTFEGRVGVINVDCSTKQQPVSFNPICGKPIYSLIWMDNYILVVCNDRIAVYDTDNTNKKDGSIISNIKGVSTITKYDKYLIVGTVDGHVDLYVPTDKQINSDVKQLSDRFSYKIAQHLELASRYISDMSWNPIINTKLAIVANENTIHIMDFDPVAVRLVIARKIQVKSPKAANSTVKWSNCNANIFLTCGLDGIVSVWNLTNPLDEEMFVKSYHCPMMCGLFLPTDENVIMCAGKSTSLEFINISPEQKKEINKSKSKNYYLHALDNIQWATKAISSTKKSKNNKKKKSNNAATLETRCIANESKDGDAVVNDETICNKTNGKQSTDVIPKNRNTKESLHFLTNPTTLLYLTSKELNKEAENIILNILKTNLNDQEKGDEIDSLCCKLYRTKAEAKELLNKELLKQKHGENQGVAGVFMQQLNSSLKEEILTNIQSKQLSEWHVSLAPSISYSFWQKCCEAFAEQLMEQGYGLQAATYMLAVYRQQDAIRMLLTKEYFKEALLLARIYLQPEDSLNQQINEQWINNLISNGNLIPAALLCLLSKQNKRALDCLMKIRNKTTQIELIIEKLKSSKSEVNN